MTFLPMLCFGTAGEMLWGLGVELALLSASVQLGLLHFYLGWVYRRSNSEYEIARMSIDALVRALPEGSDISAVDQMRIMHATQRHKMTYGARRAHLSR